MHNAYLAIGSNLGERSWHLAEAVRRLHAPPQLRVVVVSSVYASPAVGYAAQPEFLNAVLRVTTTCSPYELLARCLQIEADLGRVRLERWGPRTIDIDVLLYEELVLDDPALTIPHARMRKRSFVLTPLAEIAPDLAVGGKSVQSLASSIDSGGLRKIAPLSWAPAETATPNDAAPGS
ncbi:MAG: 2-amino-4-hydroxy-6-hydroxymethyldihydropteridine diphosphokinase [Opitutaceae bacterium]|nr:2-amino-4-hydroxy-6-hydroxymethyldihydropteridine diphosphokinase [Opitutaceae bacterium]